MLKNQNWHIDDCCQFQQGLEPPPVGLLQRLPPRLRRQQRPCISVAQNCKQHFLGLMDVQKYQVLNPLPVWVSMLFLKLGLVEEREEEVFSFLGELGEEAPP